MNFRILIITWIALGVAYAIYSIVSNEHIKESIIENDLDTEPVILAMMLSRTYLILVATWPYGLIHDLIITIRS